MTLSWRPATGPEWQMYLIISITIFNFGIHHSIFVVACCRWPARGARGFEHRFPVCVRHCFDLTLPGVTITSPLANVGGFGMASYLAGYNIVARRGVHHPTHQREAAYARHSGVERVHARCTLPIFGTIRLYVRSSASAAVLTVDYY